MANANTSQQGLQPLPPPHPARHRFVGLLPDSQREHIATTFRNYAIAASDANALVKQVQGIIETGNRIDPSSDGDKSVTLFHEYGDLAREYAQKVLADSDCPTGDPEITWENYPHSLLDHHREKLISSAITPDVAAKRGYYSATTRSQLDDLGFSRSQQTVIAGGAAALIIPLYNASGSKAGFQMRPDNPRISAQNKPLKYETPGQQTSVIDVPPASRYLLRNGQVPMLITEGALKADSAASQGLLCLAISGVYGFRGRNEYGSYTVLPDWEEIAFKNREIPIVFDSDVTEKESVYRALLRLHGWIRMKGGDASVKRLPPGPHGEKTGLDDFFFRGQTPEQLLRLPGELPSAPEKKELNPYRIEDGCIVQRVERMGHESSTIICDFQANITEEMIMETGENRYLIEGETRHGDPFVVEINASTFDDDQALKKILGAKAGSRAAIRAGAYKHLGPAIKLLSTGEVRVTRRFDRTGWHDGRFLIPGRERQGQKIALPSDLPYQIDPKAELEQGQKALEALLQAQEPEVTTPLLAAYFQAPFGWRAGLKKRNAVHVYGRTGSFKTTINQLMMALWGPKFVDDEFLTRWGEGATTNSVLAQAVHCADITLLVDNYKPNTDKPDSFTKMVHLLVEGSDKKRLDRNSDRREVRPIRSLPIFTGEDLPDKDAASLARVLAIPFPVFRRRINTNLTQAQNNSGHLCAVGSAWLDWLESDIGGEIAERSGQIFTQKRDAWAERLFNLRSDTQNVFRIASNLAANELTWWAMEQCSPLQPIAEKFRDAHASGLQAIARAMSDNTAESLEAERYLSVIRQLLASSKCALGSRGGPRPQGSGAVLLGYKEDVGAYILPDVARMEVEKLLGQNGLNGISERGLYAQLKQLGKIASFDAGRLTKTVKLHSGSTQRVLHLNNAALNDGDVGDCDVEDDTD
jgi:hypothetical protein